MGFPTLLESELLAVSKALGDTEFGFTGYADISAEY